MGEEHVDHYMPLLSARGSEESELTMRPVILVPEDKLPPPDDAVSSLARLCKTFSGGGDPLAPRTGWSNVQTLRCPVVVHPNGMPGFLEEDRRKLVELFAEDTYIPNEVARDKLHMVATEKKNYKLYRAAFDLLCIMLCGQEVVLFSGGGRDGIQEWESIRELWDVCGLKEDHNYYRVSEDELWSRFDWEALAQGRVTKLSKRLPARELIVPLLPVDILAQGIIVAREQGVSPAELGPLFAPDLETENEDYWFRPAYDQMSKAETPFEPFAEHSMAHVRRFEIAAVGSLAASYQRLSSILLPAESLMAAETLVVDAQPAADESVGALRLIWEMVRHHNDQERLDAISPALSSRASKFGDDIGLLCRLAHTECRFVCQSLKQLEKTIDELESFNARRSRFNHNRWRPEFLAYLSSAPDLAKGGIDEAPDQRQKRVATLSAKLVNMEDASEGLLSAGRVWPELRNEIEQILTAARNLRVGRASETFPPDSVTQETLDTIDGLMAGLAEWQTLSQSRKTELAVAGWNACLLVDQWITGLNPNRHDAFASYFEAEAL